MTDIRLRAATHGDLPLLVEVIASAYAAERARLSGIPDVTEGLDAHIRDDIVQLAERAGALLGVIVLVKQENALMVANVAVSAEAQGAGIGGQLMRLAEQMARGEGYDRLILRTHAGMSATRRFYAKLGWVETGVSGQVVTMQNDL
ncbi:GNAT family N-acetyltransferase [Ruegeria sp. 2205SS24-7]|uniref:GNAT family N-acetyltransferase n=1 Tax=Ruegeria discodermiae TaxID=3064389 RepID=UPI002741EACA|nr:GNAT family N-acetyltransferase [Ruegeria sp. 2205SS24-7]MDP5216312.1 GNAT family N-acetyltransferase [Ruegeria sp. 2205SS24-7]